MVGTLLLCDHLIYVLLTTYSLSVANVFCLVLKIPVMLMLSESELMEFRTLHVYTPDRPSDLLTMDNLFK